MCWAAREDSRWSSPRWHAECRLHLSKRGAAVEGVAAVGVTQPVRRYWLGDPCPLRGALQHVPDCALSQPSAALVRGEDGIVGTGIAAQGKQRRADDCGKQDLAHPAAFARHRELYFGVTLDHVGPG